ncbi:MAG: RNA polymerase sigma factor [Nitriliruptoraceae bacterium]
MQAVQTRSLQQLAREELPGLYALGWHLAGAQAEDLVQETLLRACRSFGSLRDDEAGGAWLRSILTNVWRDRLRRSGREPTAVPVEDEQGFSLYQRLSEEDPLPYSDTMHLDVLGSFSRRDVQEVLARLPDHYRAPLVLRYIEGRPTEEIAQMLELPLGTVCSQLQRGRQRFERELWHYAEESGVIDPAPPDRGASGDVDPAPADRGGGGSEEVDT